MDNGAAESRRGRGVCRGTPAGRDFPGLIFPCCQTKPEKERRWAERPTQARGRKLILPPSSSESTDEDANIKYSDMEVDTVLSKAFPEGTGGSSSAAPSGSKEPGQVLPGPPPGPVPSSARRIATSGGSSSSGRGSGQGGSELSGSYADAISL